MQSPASGSAARLLPALLAGLLGLAGCQTYNSKSAGMYSAWQGGNAEAAASEATRRAEEAAGGRDELLWRLEQGTTLAKAGQLENSTEAFDRAESLVNQFENDAKIKLGGRTASLLTNQAVLPYRGRAYDKIMMNAYKALNYMEADNPAAARVELNRAMQRQRDAVDENSRRIQEAVDQAEAARKGRLEKTDGSTAPGYDVARAQEDPRFANATEAEMNRLEDHILPYADYVNPFAVFLDGLFFCYYGVDGSDLERARKSFERVAAMSPGPYTEADRAMAERVASGGPVDIVTYLVFATGSAPTRSENKIEIPLWLVSREVSYVAASFPRLEFSSRYSPQLIAFNNDGEEYPTQMLCSMDSVIARDFRNEWPAVMTNTLLTTAVKALAGYALEDSVKREDEAVRFLAQIVNIGYQASTNVADLRTWTTLPKAFTYVRMPTPEDGQVNFKAGMYDSSVEVVPGKANFILVRSVNSSAFPIVSHFTLN